MTKEEIEAVLAGCDGVTPGPWTVYHDTCAKCEKEGRAEYDIRELPDGYHAMLGEKADAAHIARLSPEFVRDLATLALEALSSRDAGWQGKIRPLAWIKPQGAEFMRRAQTVVGTYRVWTHHEADGRWFWELGGGCDIVDGRARTQQECFDQAQADYEQRIRSAFLPNPPDQGSKSP